VKSQKEENIVKRINRKLQGNNQYGKPVKVVKARSQQTARDVGEYYLVDVYQNAVVEHDVNIRARAEQLGVL
jgi:hypothetical protein